MKTKLYVLTGAPSSGKSSIILALEADRKEYVVREAAEDLIKLYQSKGIAQPWLLFPEFQERLLQLQLQRESMIPHIGRAFIDRGTLDGLAYIKLDKLAISPAYQKEFERVKEGKKYEKIFLIENLGNCQTNKIRKEDMETALTMEQMQFQNYTNYGYKVVRVPAMPVAERVKFILKNL